MPQNHINQLHDLQAKLRLLLEQFESLNNETSALADKMYELQRQIVQANRDLASTIILMEKTADAADTPSPKIQPDRREEPAANADSPVHVSQPVGKVVDVRYFSFYDGGGIAMEDTTDEESARSIFVIEIMEDNTARFYPCQKAATRIINSADQYQGTLCDFDEDVTTEDFAIPENCYGMLRQDSPGHWVVTRRCRIAHR